MGVNVAVIVEKVDIRPVEASSRPSAPKALLARIKSNSKEIERLLAEIITENDENERKLLVKACNQAKKIHAQLMEQKQRQRNNAAVFMFGMLR